MSPISATASFDAAECESFLEKSPKLARQICDAGLFLRNLRVHMRFGELTRAPLRLLCLQTTERWVECDWLAREPDPWDVGLPDSVGRRHASLQALRDAIEIRELLFYCFPKVETAIMHVYRPEPPCNRELIIIGTSERRDRAAPRIRSLAMRAQLLGFRFSLEGDVLRKLPGEAYMVGRHTEYAGRSACEAKNQPGSG